MANKKNKYKIPTTKHIDQLETQIEEIKEKIDEYKKEPSNDKKLAKDMPKIHKKHFQLKAKLKRLENKDNYGPKNTVKHDFKFISEEGKKYGYNLHFESKNKRIRVHHLGSRITFALKHVEEYKDFNNEAKLLVKAITEFLESFEPNQTLYKTYQLFYTRGTFQILKPNEIFNTGYENKPIENKKTKYEPKFIFGSNMYGPKPSININEIIEKIEERNRAKEEQKKKREIEERKREFTNLFYQKQENGKSLAEFWEKNFEFIWNNDKKREIVMTTCKYCGKIGHPLDYHDKFDKWIDGEDCNNDN